MRSNEKVVIDDECCYNGCDCCGCVSRPDGFTGVSFKKGTKISGTDYADCIFLVQFFVSA